MFLWLTRTKDIIVIELTVPWEDVVKQMKERDKVYESCQNVATKVGKHGTSKWRLDVKALLHSFSVLGVTGQRRRTAVQGLRKAAKKAC